jgi:hypothetical protein
MHVPKYGTLIAALAFVAIASAAESASAYYPCGVRYIPGSGAAGREGHVWFGEFTGPKCTGSMIRTWQLCSPGATSTACTRDTYLQYNRAAMLVMFEALRAAAATGQWVGIIHETTTCVGGGTGCFGYALFDAEPL